MFIFTLSLISSFVSPPSDSNSLGYIGMNYNGPSTFVAVYKNAFRGLIGQELEINNTYRIRNDANEAADYLRDKQYSKYFEYLAMIFGEFLPYLMITTIALTFISLFFKGN